VQKFREDFLSATGCKKCIFGCNVYTRALIECLPVDYVVDDLSNEPAFSGIPIIRSENLAPNDMVIAASGGKPLTVRGILEGCGVVQIDYFSFQKYSGLKLPELIFNEGFAAELFKSKCHFEWVYGRLKDSLSQQIFRNLLSFRLNQDLVFLQGFRDRQREQYFEDFLALDQAGETFFDVGGFDGYTSLEFVKHCPDYAAICVFEPEPGNREVCRQTLAKHKHIEIFPFGLSDENNMLCMEAAGSASKISNKGSISIEVKRLDDVRFAALSPSFIKMDIEGGELQAIRGAADSIRKYTPRLAISVYHNPADFWRIPREVISIHPSYNIYLRHYTESIYESIMFFVP
jgi:FkbM family methyltransferase